ncbi:MAG: SpoIID/LytB domain-containing protein [Clostridiales bacterium]|nr:SpoIID/LytB domain-containing protein [Clostridiales bacterium]
MFIKRTQSLYALKIICILLVFALFIGCTSRRAPSPGGPNQQQPPGGQQSGIRREAPTPTAPKGDETGQEAKKPALPKALNATDGQEPSLQVFIKEDNNVQEMKLEEYITKVVAGEIKNDWPDEAIKAQAIIARTFVLDFIDEKGHSKHGKAHISTDIEEAQAWNPEAVNDKIKNAVNDTRGLIMTFDGKFAKGWFHSNAAGTTATPKEGLNFKGGDPPYIKVVKSPDDSPQVPGDEKNWEYSASKAKVLEALKTMGKPIKDFSKVTMGEKGESGRILNLDFDGTKVSAPDFRVALDSKGMKSTMLEKVELQGDKVVFKGRGYGHGVGMSQWGAFKMAKEGKKAEDIISHYFQGIKIVKVWR